MRTTFVLILGVIIFIFSCKNKSEESNTNQLEDEYVLEKPIYSSTNTPNSYSETKIDEETNFKDCSDAHSSGDDAYYYCRRAYNSDDYDEVKSYLKKAISSFEDAMSNAEDCKCDDAYSSADEGYTFAKRGYNSDDFDEMKDYAKKAKNSAEDIMSNADDCTNN